MRTLDPGRTQVNIISSNKREHSRKPDEQYKIIEACSPGPYLEMFCRHPQPNWACWGNEVDEDKVVYHGRKIIEPPQARLFEKPTKYKA
jgi:N6-adenosine-specific RNA methylase IME4